MLLVSGGIHRGIALLGHTMLEKKNSIYHARDGGFDAQLFQSSADCIKILDLEGRVVEVNPGAVQALELDGIDHLNGVAWTAFWPEENRETVEDAVISGLAGTRARFGGFCPTSKGTERWWDVVVSPIHEADGAITQLMVVSRDVTDVYLARQALQEANQRKDEFFALLSHELRNPLAAAGMAGLSAAKVADIGQLIQRQVTHMSRLAEDLLDVSRVTRGDINLKMEPVDLKEVVRAALEQLQSTYVIKKQSVTSIACEAPCIVMGDYTRLIQVVGNVVGNAVRYTAAGGSIALTMTRTADSVTLEVHDSGVGIAPQEIATLFDLYKTVSRSDARRSGGLGIGLALVRSLLNLHRGTVSVASPGPGQGSTFTITLPAGA
jgi:PAS domain S-box-containing protein